MNFDPIAAEAELNLAYRKTRNELVLAAIPLLMSAVAAVGLRRQRNQLRAVIAQIGPIDVAAAEVIDADVVDEAGEAPEPPGEEID